MSDPARVTRRNYMDTLSRGTAAPRPDTTHPHPVTARVRAALAVTRTKLPDHWRALLASRTRGDAQATGSVTDHTSAAALDAALDAAVWQPYTHPAVAPGCVAFWSRDLPGQLGLVAIDKLPADAVLTLRDPHHTGTLSAEVEGAYGARAEGTCLILGAHDGAEVVFTFHPGAPVAPSTLAAEGQDGRTVTRDEARDLGFALAKVRRPA